uniref:Uncharacterized protein n=1 Tax=Opuntia streptacantha TaxID=393608 RepID=A0A7C8ZN62_OPUST
MLIDIELCFVWFCNTQAIILINMSDPAKKSSDGGQSQRAGDGKTYSGPNTGYNENKGGTQTSGRIRSEQVLTGPSNTGYNVNGDGKQSSGNIEYGKSSSGCHIM